MKIPVNEIKVTCRIYPWSFWNYPKLIRKRNINVTNERNESHANDEKKQS